MLTDHLTLEDLSAATGMTARNVRAYQTKGLIPPPTRQGRRSVYGEEHLRRLQAIERARARGASLSLIASHLAEGRPLEGDTLIGWPGDAAGQPPPDDVPAGAPGPGPRAEIGGLLATLDHHRDPAAHRHLEQLLAAGVFQREGRRVYTGQELAAALGALQRHGLPLAAALGVAQRAMAAAGPIADAVRRTVAGLDPGPDRGAGSSPGSLAGPLGEVACCVVRHVVGVDAAD